MVRSYEPKDEKRLREICIETSGFSIKSKKDREFLYYMYNDYYTEFEPESCFVAVNDNDEAIGYILCAKDFDAYLETMNKFYIPRIVHLGFKYNVIVHSEIFAYKLLKKNYPAHLHIDILPEYQKTGLGRKLVDELKAYLKAQEVPGVMLSVGVGNKGAIEFYKKNGFKTQINLFGSNLMVFDIE